MSSALSKKVAEKSIELLAACMGKVNLKVLEQNESFKGFVEQLETSIPLAISKKMDEFLSRSVASESVESIQEFLNSIDNVFFKLAIEECSRHCGYQIDSSIIDQLVSALSFSFHDLVSKTLPQSLNLTQLQEKLFTSCLKDGFVQKAIEEFGESAMNSALQSEYGQRAVEMTSNLTTNLVVKGFNSYMKLIESDPQISHLQKEYLSNCRILEHTGDFPILKEDAERDVEVSMNALDQAIKEKVIEKVDEDLSQLNPLERKAGKLSLQAVYGVVESLVTPENCDTLVDNFVQMLQEKERKFLLCSPTSAGRENYLKGMLKANLKHFLVLSIFQLKQENLLDSELQNLEAAEFYKNVSHLVLAHYEKVVPMLETFVTGLFGTRNFLNRQIDGAFETQP